MPKDLNEFVEYLEGKEIKHLQIKKEIKENETHNSLFPKALSNGLRYVLDGL